MSPVVVLGLQSEMQSLSPKSKRRKHNVMEVNGSSINEDSKEKKNSCTVEDCEENIRRKKRRKLAHLKQEDGQETSDTVANSEPKLTAAVDGNDSKSGLKDEVEIWIPNKKYKGPLRDAYTKLAAEGSGKVKRRSAKKNDSLPFMTFIPVDKTPAALVRRRNKLSHSEPKALHKSVSFMLLCHCSKHSVRQC